MNSADSWRGLRQPRSDDEQLHDDQDDEHHQEHDEHRTHLCITIRCDHHQADENDDQEQHHQATRATHSYASRRDGPSTNVGERSFTNVGGRRSGLHFS
ncbi:hypothetical protein ACH4E7_43735 [Kitasatospora sp. NPDC018058]|uniref:hypothetical protein n=1 Tax=Kitasatospora sp. NPDC018058 TaxID=3364025 RepID=UPI0037C080C7